MSDSSCCAPTRAGKAEPSAPQPEGGGHYSDPVVDLPGGTFAMGYEGPLANPGEGEGPVRQVEVGPFAIGTTTVTRTAFAAFVEATGHVTAAEAEGWSFVFADFVAPDASVRGRVAGAEWWVAVDGADWRQPHGPGSPVQPANDHPVTQVSWDDATAYAAWVGGRLPTEAEWEYAARGGLDGKVFPWGDRFRVGGKAGANIWQGDFPTHSNKRLANRATAPVTMLAPNSYGLHHAVGNVWEWTADHWSVDGRTDDGQRVRKGGSYLCHDSYCNRYRVAARDHSAPGDATANIGFRVAFG